MCQSVVFAESASPISPPHLCFHFLSPSLSGDYSSFAVFIYTERYTETFHSRHYNSCLFLLVDVLYNLLYHYSQVSDLQTKVTKVII